MFGGLPLRFGGGMMGRWRGHARERGPHGRAKSSRRPRSGRRRHGAAYVARFGQAAVGGGQAMANAPFPQRRWPAGRSEGEFAMMPPLVRAHGGRPRCGRESPRKVCAAADDRQVADLVGDEPRRPGMEPDFSGQAAWPLGPGQRLDQLGERGAAGRGPGRHGARACWARKPGPGSSSTPPHPRPKSAVSSPQRSPRRAMASSTRRSAAGRRARHRASFR